MTDQTTDASAKADKATTENADDIRANAVAAMEDIEATEPTPTQAELDAIKRGEHHSKASYKTRQTKA